MKKIAVIENGWGKFTNYAWTHGMRQYITENHLDIDIFVFNSFGNVSLDELYNSGEYNIANLPDFTEFDAIILELTNIGDEEIRKSIIERAKKSKVPTISMVDKIDGFYYAGIDNYQAMYHIVEHLIVKHGCKTLNYIGGPITNSENTRRFRAYQDVLQKYGIPYEEERVYQRDYEIITGQKGFEYFRKNERMADAIVCANDNIAVGVCRQAEMAGYCVPDDFLVTGFDNFDKAAYFKPRISTVGFIREDIAYNAMKLIHQIWNGQDVAEATYIDVTWEFQDSCGCVPQHPRSRSQYVVRRIFSDYENSCMQNRLMELKRDLINCDNYEQMAACLPQRMASLDYDEFYMLINRDLLESSDFEQIELETKHNYRTQGYPPDIALLAASKAGEPMQGIKKKRGELVPGYKQEGGCNFYLFLPLHFRDREIGYMVLKNCEYLMDSEMLFEVLNIFLESMENLYHRNILTHMNKELSKLYMMDSLTGLYNRMAYSKLAVPLYNKCMREQQTLALLFVDLDGLKYINDNFGHDMGNVAIKTVAEAVKKSCPKTSVIMRYGGDEFVVLVPDMSERKAENLQKRIEDCMKERAATLDVQFPIGASIGYVVAKDATKSLNDCINEADDRMYEIKKAHKKNRI